MKYLTLLLLTLSITFCSTTSNKEGGEGSSEFELESKGGKWVRIERFKNSGGIRARGEVKAECGGAKCNEEQVSKFAPAKIKSLPKQGIWEEFLQFEQEGSTPENPKFKSILDSTGEYVEGKKVGIWKKPDPENPSRSIGEVQWVDGKKEGIAKTFDKSGTVLSETEFHDDKKNGVYWKKTSKGEWLEKGSHKDNEEDGPWTYHFTGSDGNGIKTSVSFLNGKKNGLETNFYKDGKIESQGNYVSGSRNGPWKLFGNKENVLAEGSYSPKAGVAEDAEIKYERSGVWKEYYPDGKLLVLDHENILELAPGNFTITTDKLDTTVSWQMKVCSKPPKSLIKKAKFLAMENCFFL
jgi:antitoxin component YwqK of YwqJK toxin-antitoxin module